MDHLVGQRRSSSQGSYKTYTLSLARRVDGGGFRFEVEEQRVGMAQKILEIRIFQAFINPEENAEPTVQKWHRAGALRSVKQLRDAWGEISSVLKPTVGRARSFSVFFPKVWSHWAYHVLCPWRAVISALLSVTIPKHQGPQREADEPCVWCRARNLAVFSKGAHAGDTMTAAAGDAAECIGAGEACQDAKDASQPARRRSPTDDAGSSRPNGTSACVQSDDMRRREMISSRD